MEANPSAAAASDHAGYTVTWENVNCAKVVHSLIDNTGFARPGESLAIIGPSGAGKTTLLGAPAHILSQKSLGEITGEVLVNGTKPDTLMFAAECRMPRNSTHEERVARVDEVIAGLELTNAQNTPMIARPHMFFLDEPTSGLDDFGARCTMELVLKYVKSENVCVVIVIHQPSEAVFNLFDNTMLLSEGRTANTQAAATYYDKSPLACANLAELNRLKSQTYSPVRHIVERQWWELMRLLGWRCLMRYWRNP
ncbi:P-loop containing nucleoside triphosphate hydrolase protein [Hyaloraphidium curvatum]|nr:P-loop containing nucleoside triphosphate hydrolase protein [Hyaloraphidium curvatum]